MLNRYAVKTSSVEVKLQYRIAYGEGRAKMSFITQKCMLNPEDALRKNLIQVNDYLNINENIEVIKLKTNWNSET
jgi:hypothetical protein